MKIRMRSRQTFLHTRGTLYSVNLMIFISLAVRFFALGRRRTFRQSAQKNIVQGRNIFYGCSIHEKTRFTRLFSLLLIRRVIFIEDSYKRDRELGNRRMVKLSCVLQKYSANSFSSSFGHVKPRERCVCVSHSNAIFNNFAIIFSVSFKNSVFVFVKFLLEFI